MMKMEYDYGHRMEIRNFTSDGDIATAPHYQNSTDSCATPVCKTDSSVRRF